MVAKTILYLLAFGLLSVVIGEVSAAASCRRIPNLDHEFFNTKTNYETARRRLKGMKEDDLPGSFDDDSLKEEHEELLEDSCKPVVFYFFGRHAARFPDSEEIEEMNHKLHELQKTLEEKSELKDCANIKKYIHWTTKVKPEHDNLLTNLGAKTERDIAKRFKKIYPEFFDAEKSDIKIGVTSKIRTSQTGAEFLKEVEGLEIPHCEESSIPTHDLDSKNYDLEKIHENKCYKTMTERYELPFLKFDEQCEKIGGKHKAKNELLCKLKESHLLREIGDHVAEKLGLPTGEKSPITHEMVDVIYDACRYETANDKDSMWCDLFDKKDIELLEYMKDIEVYIKNAYGPHANNKQACPVIKDLLHTFHEGLKLSTDSHAKRKSIFYFSHASPMKKLLAAFHLFHDDDSYTERKVEELIEKKKIDDDRDWRTSLVVPFSGNIAFILYKCQKPGKEVKHKILTAVTEQPVKIGTCKDTDCNSERFFERYEDFNHCDLEHICKHE